MRHAQHTITQPVRPVARVVAVILAGVLIASSVVVGVVPQPKAAQAMQTAKGSTCQAGKAERCAFMVLDAPITAAKTFDLPAYTAHTASARGKLVTYHVETRGNVADVTEFKALAAETLNSPLGWARMGVRFSQVESGGDFTLVLAESSFMTSFSETGCSADWSCNVGGFVIINNTRWTKSSDAWVAGGGSLRDYRHMVINHETGHWLSHGHQQCSAPGAKAAVMQQQSIDLMGCVFNPWPLDSELTSSRLGI
jgi:hypothetical protein